MTSCAQQRQAAAPKESDSPYHRKPMVEVTEEQLKTEAQQIDATTQLLIGKPQEAVGRYQKLLKTTPTYAPAHYELGKIYLAVGWLDSALYHTQQALRTNGDNLWYELQLARIYELRNDSKNLTATWEDIVKRHPDRVDFYYSLSNAYLMANNATGSIEALDRVEKRYGVTEAVSLQKQKLWMAIGKPDKARKELEKLAAAMPDDTRYNAILAETYMSEKNYSQALQYYNRILDANPNDENIHISLASCHMAMGNLEQTYRHLRLGALNEEVSCENRLTYIIEFLRNKGFFVAYSKPCFRLADTVAQQCADEVGHTFLYGQLLASQERYAEAAVQIARYLEVDRSQYAVWEALLVCESAAGSTDSSLMAHAQQASELFPLHLRPHLILAQGHLSLGNCDEARKHIARCQLVAPGDASVVELYQTIEQTCQ